MISKAKDLTPVRTKKTKTHDKHTKTVAQHAVDSRMTDFKTRFKLKLVSKKLASGKCQVKFFASTPNSGNLYGYTLVEANTTLKEVVESITTKLEERQHPDSFYHGHLYTLGQHNDEPGNFMIFDD